MIFLLAKAEGSKIEVNPNDILEVSSKLVDWSGVIITAIGILFAILTIGLGLFTFLFQRSEKKKRDLEIENAIKDVTDKISKDNKFTNRLIQALFQEDKMKQYIDNHIKQSIETRAITLITDEFVAEQHKKYKDLMLKENDNQNTEDDIPF